MVEIIVCVKQVFDPEAPSSAYAVDSNEKWVLPPTGSPPVLSPYDENALEAALQIKDSHEAHITVVSLGANLSKAVLQKTLAVGSYEKLDLILCGRQSSDANTVAILDSFLQSGRL